MRILSVKQSRQLVMATKGALAVIEQNQAAPAQEMKRQLRPLHGTIRPDVCLNNDGVSKTRFKLVAGSVATRLDGRFTDAG